MTIKAPARYCAPIILGLALTVSTFPVVAQDVPPGADPGALQQQREMEERRRELQEELEQRRQLDEQLDTEAVTRPDPHETAPDDVRFQVNEIRFSASDILTTEELRGTAQHLVGQEISLADLRNLLDAVNALYRDRGIVTAQAVLPPQDLTEGVVIVRLIEGRLGHYRLEGAEHTREGYILRRFTMQPGDLVELPVLEQDLTRFNLLHDVALRAELRPGEAIGETDIQLTAAERQRHTIRVSADNTGNAATGRTRVGAAYRNASVFGLRDDFTLSASQSDGHVSGSVGYGAPIGDRGTRARLGFSYDRTELNRGPIAELGVTGSSTAWTGSLRHPVVLDRRMRVDAFTGFAIRTPKTILEGVLLQDARIRNVNVGIDGHRLDAYGYWLGSSSVTRAKSTGLESDRRDFTILRGSLNRTQYLGDRFSLQVSTQWQYARGDAAPSSEQFLIGGVGSVRGYESGQFGGDRGHSISVELHHPIFARGGGDSERVSGFAFVDMGRTYPFRSEDDPQPERYNIRSFGWGLDARLFEDVTLRATIGKGMVRYPETRHQHYLNFQFLWHAL